MSTITIVTGADAPNLTADGTLRGDALESRGHDAIAVRRNDGDGNWNRFDAAVIRWNLDNSTSATSRTAAFPSSQRDSSRTLARWTSRRSSRSATGDRRGETRDRDDRGRRPEDDPRRGRRGSGPFRGARRSGAATATEVLDRDSRDGAPSTFEIPV